MSVLGDAADAMRAVLDRIDDAHVSLAATVDSLDGAVDRLVMVGAVGKAEQVGAARDQAQSSVSAVAAMRERAEDILRQVHALTGRGSGGQTPVAPTGPSQPGSGALRSEAARIRPQRTPTSREIYRDRHGFLTDGVYRVSTDKNVPHVYETREPGKSYFAEGTDVDRLSLEAAQTADSDDLWRADPGGTYRRRAKVSYDHDVGMHARTGQSTRVVNVYRKRSGTIHISPGSPE